MARRKNHEAAILRTIQPLTQGQHDTFNAFDREKSLVLHGYAGTGKTFISLYLALRELQEADTPFYKVIIVRSAVPSRDMGFMPGSLEEKLEVFQSPYCGVVNDLMNRPTAYQEMKKAGAIEFLSTSYIRGRTFDNCILIVDEIQNMDWGELTSIITRVGPNVRIIFSGDFRQSDFRGWEEKSKPDMIRFMEVLKNIDEFECIEFGTTDIVRSPLVRKFILMVAKMGYDE